MAMAKMLLFHHIIVIMSSAN